MARSTRALQRGSHRLLLAGFLTLGTLGGLAAVELLQGGSAAAAPTCTIYWTGAVSSNWTTNGNWSLTDGGASAGRVPNGTDYVCMSTTPTTATASLSASTTISGLDWPATATVLPSLSVSGALTLGSSTAANPSSIAELTVTGTTKAITGETIAAGTLDTGGTLEGPGTMTVAGTTTVEGGQLGLSGTKTSGLHLVLDGPTSLSGTGFYLYEGSTLENAAAMTLADNTNLVDEDDLANKVLNDAAGTITYAASGPHQNAYIQASLVNNGAVTVSKGTLSIEGNGTTASSADTGSFSAGANATLDLGGTRVEGATASLSGAGTIDVTGQVTLQASANLSNSDNLEVNGTLVVASGAAPTVAGLDVEDGTLQGPGDLTVSGQASLESGQLGADGTKSTGLHLVLDGPTLVSGSFSLFEGSTLENAATMTLADNTDLVDEDDLGSKVVNDPTGAITYTASGPHQTAYIQASLFNGGAVTVSKGTLSIQGDGTTATTDSGSFAAAAGAILDLGGSRSETATATLSGAGTIDVTGVVTLQASANLTNSDGLEVDGTLVVASGAAPTVAGLDLEGGTLQGPGGLTVSGQASLENGQLGAAGTKTSGLDLVLDGPTTVSGSQFSLYEGSTLENAAVMTLTDNTSIVDNDDLGNRVSNDATGTITYAANSPVQSAYIQAPLLNNGVVTVIRGTLNIEGNGTSVRSTDSGSFAAAAGAILDLGGSRSETATATLSGAGTIDVTGVVTLQASANLTNSDGLEVDGTLVVASGAAPTVAGLDLEGGTLQGPGGLTVSGQASLENGQLGAAGTKTSGLDLVLDGPTTVSGSQFSLYEGSTLENAAVMTLTDNTDIVDEDGLNNEVLNDPSGTVVYAGSTNSQTATIDAPLDNDGVLSVATGTLSVADGLTNLSVGVLTGGTYTSTGGTLALPGTVATNAATILVGSGGAMTSGGANLFAGLSTNRGFLSIGRAESVGRALTNSGTLTVLGGKLKVTSFAQSGGTTTVAGGATLQSGSTGTGGVAVSAGTLTGNGTIAGAVSGAGTFTPGSSSGPLAISGSYAPSSGATLAINVSKPQNVGTDFGQLSVSGSATVQGALSIQTAAGYTPPLGTAYTVVTAGSLTGTFTSVTGLGLGASQYQVSYTPTSVVLTVVQVPTITSAAAATFATASSSTFTVTTSGSPTPALTETGTIPGGVTFVDNGNGTATLSGTPTSGGSFTITITASNGVAPNATQAFTLTVVSVTKVAPAKIAQGATNVAATITGTGFSAGAKLSASNTGITFSSTVVKSATSMTAKLTVTPSVPVGTYNLTVTTGGVSATCVGCLSVTAAARTALHSLSPVIHVTSRETGSVWPSRLAAGLLGRLPSERQ